MNVGAASAANNPSDRDEFAAEAAPAKLKTSVFSVTSVASILMFTHSIQGRAEKAIDIYSRRGAENAKKDE